jgi:hypothetical protein
VFTKARHWTLYKESVQVRGTLKHFVKIKNFYGEGLRPHAQPPSWITTPCRLSATAYSIYSQLPSVPEGLPSIRNLRTRHAVVTRDPTNMGYESYMCVKGKGKVVPLLLTEHYAMKAYWGSGGC